MGVPIVKPLNPIETYYEHKPTGTRQLSEVNSSICRARRMHYRSASDNNITIRDKKTQNAISSQIDKCLQKQKNEDRLKVKILLLGGADAGKSTILKQMRILHMNGFNEDEIRSFKKHLRFNVFQIFHEMAIEVRQSVQTIADNEQTVIDKYAEGLSWISGMHERKEIEAILSFSKLKCIRQFMKCHPGSSSLPDNAHYYIPNLSTLLSAEYVPTAEDILHLRIPTSAVNEIHFSFGDAKIRLIDVGGQKAYRKKWIHHFEGVSAVLFVASMAAYDQSLEAVDRTAKPVLQKDVFTVAQEKSKTGNRLRDSVLLFGEMIRSKFLLYSAFILFLNKKDIFSNKLSNHPLEDYVPGYRGSSNKDASEFLKEYFLKRKSKKDANRMIYSHFTCATDTKNVEFVFRAVCDIVLHKNIESNGIQ